MANKHKKGDWVAEPNVRRPHFGIIKETWDDGSIDIIMFTHNGERVGRLSPPEGGPTAYEPCCPGASYAKIEKPEFPLKLEFGCWRKALKFL